MDRVFQRKHFHLCCALIAVYFVVLLFGTRNPISIDDGLRHIVMAQHYRDQGIGNVNGWGVYFFSGYFAELSFDPWFLADLSYIPFTVLSDPVRSLKAYSLVSLALIFLSFLPLLRRYRAPPLLGCLSLLLLFFGSEMFLFRLLLARPYVFVTALFLFTYLCIVQRRFFLLLPVLAIATLFSHLFVFPLALCVAATLWFLALHEYRNSAS